MTSLSIRSKEKETTFIANSANPWRSNYSHTNKLNDTDSYIISLEVVINLTNHR